MVDKFIILIFFLVLMVMDKLINMDVYFLSKEEIREFMVKDEDKYVNGLSKYDLYARKIETKEKYIDKIKEQGKNCNIIEKMKIMYCINEVNKYLDRIDNKKMNDILFNILDKEDINAIKKIKWNIAKMDEGYEDDKPHTRNNIIFITNKILNDNDNKELMKTLIHEKLHIYQRYNVRRMNEIINKMGYIKMYTREEYIKENKLLRSNPDVNDTIYYDIKNGRLCVGMYKSNEPLNIGDINEEIDDREHPYEEMSYMIEKIVDI